MNLLQRDPSGVLSVITLAAAPIAAALGHPEFAPVFVAVAALVLGLRTQVTPTVKAAEATVQATTAVALEVARNLSDGEVGGVGQVTEAAARVVNEALGTVRGLGV